MEDSGRVENRVWVIILTRADRSPTLRKRHLCEDLQEVKVFFIWISGGRVFCVEGIAKAK